MDEIFVNNAIHSENSIIGNHVIFGSNTIQTQQLEKGVAWLLTSECQIKFSQDIFLQFSDPKWIIR